MKRSHEIAFHVVMYLYVEHELALLTIQKCLVILHDRLGPNTRISLSQFSHFWYNMATDLQQYCFAVPSVVLKERICMQQIVVISPSLDRKRRKLGKTRAWVVLPPGGINWQHAFKLSTMTWQSFLVKVYGYLG